MLTRTQASRPRTGPRTKSRTYYNTH